MKKMTYYRLGFEMNAYGKHNPLLNVSYPDTNDEGPIRRCNIKPPPPAILKCDQKVQAYDRSEVYDAVMKDSWEPVSESPLTGNIKVAVLYDDKCGRYFQGIKFVHLKMRLINNMGK